MIAGAPGCEGRCPCSSGTWSAAAIVQTEMSFVAEQEHRGCREALGHRGDAEDGVGGRERVAPRDRRSDAAGMDELAVDDHAVRDAGHRLLVDERIEQAIHLSQRVVDRHAPDYSRA